VKVVRNAIDVAHSREDEGGIRAGGGEWEIHGTGCTTSGGPRRYDTSQRDRDDTAHGRTTPTRHDTRKHDHTDTTHGSATTGTGHPAVRPHQPRHPTGDTQHGSTNTWGHPGDTTYGSSPATRHGSIYGEIAGLSLIRECGVWNGCDVVCRAEPPKVESFQDRPRRPRCL